MLSGTGGGEGGVACKEWIGLSVLLTEGCVGEDCAAGQAVTAVYPAFGGCAGMPSVSTRFGREQQCRI